MGQKTHKWGPVVEVGFGALMTACKSVGCQMDLSVDYVPEKDYQAAAEFLNFNRANADKHFPCPFAKSALYPRLN